MANKLDVWNIWFELSSTASVTAGEGYGACGCYYYRNNYTWSIILDRNLNTFFRESLWLQWLWRKVYFDKRWRRSEIDNVRQASSLFWVWNWVVFVSMRPLEIFVFLAIYQLINLLLFHYFCLDTYKFSLQFSSRMYISIPLVLCRNFILVQILQ